LELKKKEYNSLVDNLAETRLVVFKQRNGISAGDVLRKYYSVLRGCIYQGGRGYQIWIPELRDRNHGVIHPDFYQRAQPLQIERDAYFAVHQKEMEVTKETHVEVWGN
jgi:hypothetical protein